MDCVMRYQKKEDGVPTRKMIEVMLSQLVKIPDHLTDAVDFARSLEKFEVTQWHSDECEKWIRQNATLQAIGQSIELIQKKELAGIVNLVSDAVNIKFDNSVGMSYADDWQRRHEHYTSEENLIDCGFKWLNKISRGGIPKKSLTCFLSNTTGGFKSGTMSHMACEMYRAENHVLYVSGEMSEYGIGERLDANLFDLEIDNLKDLSIAEFERRLKNVTDATKGSLTVKEYAVGGFSANTIEMLIKELIAKGQKPDAIFVDYLNLMASTRIPASEAGNTYQYIKSIAEELRALAQKYDVAIITATQSNRSGLRAGKDLEMDSTSESHGLPSTLDLFIAIITTEELEKSRKIMFKQLKNRRRSIGQDTFIVIPVNKARMKLYEVGNMPQLRI